MPNRKNTTHTIITALGLLLTLAALPFILLACTPTAPAGPTKPAAATPTATATSTATATPSPTATPTATAAPMPTPTPTPTPTTNSKLEPMLNTLLAQSQNAAGQTTRMVSVRIWPSDSANNDNWTNLRQLITDNGGAVLSSQEYSVPVSLPPQLTAYPAVDRITIIWPEDFPYPQMSRALNNAVAVWQAGATPQQAAAAYSPLVYDDKIWVATSVADVSAFNRLESFFIANKIFIAPELRDHYLEMMGILALVPVPLLGALSQVDGIVEISDSGEEPVPDGEITNPDDQAFMNFVLYQVLPPDLRHQLSPLPPYVWELEQIGMAPPGTPTPTATVTPMPVLTPTATIIPTPAVNPDNLGPIALALITLHSARTTGADQPAESAGSSGSTTPQATPPIPPPLLPQTLTTSISTLSLDATRAFLNANHGSIIDDETLTLANNWVTVAEVPLAALPALSQQPETLYAFVEGPYRNMPSHLNRLVMEYAVAQLTAGAAATDPEPAPYEVRVTEPGYRNVRRFLQTHGVPLTYSDAEINIPSYPAEFTQLIPVHLLGPVSQLPGVLYIDETPRAFIDDPTVPY